MKKEKNPFLVVCCILLLMVFIILPPVLRKYIPNNTESKEQTSQEKLTVLKCNKYFKEELYLVSSNVKYKNNQIDSNTITYQKLNEIPYDVENNTSITVAEEYGILSTLNNVDIVTNDNIVTVRVNQELINNNPDNTNLLNYFQSLDEQKTFYEDMGYNCNVLKS